MLDKYDNYNSGLTSPANNAFAITPDDANDLSEITRALYVGVAGNIAVVMKSGETVNFIGVSSGAILPIRVARLNETGTTASNIVGLV